MSVQKLWLSVLNRYNRTLLAAQLVSYHSSTRLSTIGFDREQYWKQKEVKMERKERQEGAKREKRPPVKRPNPGNSGNKPLRGRPADQEDVRISKTMSWLLRHGAKSEGLYMRQDGYVRVNDMVCLPYVSVYYVD